jgi:hypothetical protein
VWPQAWVHPHDPLAIYQVKDTCKYLNYARAVGGLMRHFRELQGKPTLTFIERLRTAPLVSQVTPLAGSSRTLP